MKKKGGNVSTKVLAESEKSGPLNTLDDPKHEYIYGYLSPSKKSSTKKQSMQGNVTFGASPLQSEASSKLNQHTIENYVKKNKASFVTKKRRVSQPPIETLPEKDAAQEPA